MSAQVDAPAAAALGGFAGVAQQVDEDLLDLAGIPCELEAGGIDPGVQLDTRLGELQSQQLLDAGEKAGHRYDLERRRRHPGEPAVGLDELQQALAAPLNRADRGADVPGGLPVVAPFLQHAVRGGGQRCEPG